jgi:hypothetical protein
MTATAWPAPSATARVLDLTFQVGAQYQTRALCDWDCIFTLIVTERTRQFVTFHDPDDHKRYRCKVRVWRGVEHCNPYGRYSMAPTFSADRHTV